MADDEIVVSVCCVTYNHENYIGQCIDGFLSQKTNFKIEILVHDDASNDSTQDVLRRYQQENPGRLHVIYQTENQWVKNKRNPYIHILLPLTKGKYVAVCEGDDYWTDPLKLQKQVDLLESDPEASFCFTKVKLVSDEPIDSHSYEAMDHYPERITLDDYLQHYYPIPMLTKVFRKSMMTDYSTEEWNWKEQVKFLDNVMHMNDLLHGPAIYLNEVTGAYRIQAHSITRTAPKDNLWYLEEILLTHKYFADAAPANYRDRFLAIRAHHYVRILDNFAAKKQVVNLLKTAARFMLDDHAGRPLDNLQDIWKTLLKHLRIKFNK